MRSTAMWRKFLAGDGFWVRRRTGWRRRSGFLRGGAEIRRPPSGEFLLIPASITPNGAKDPWGQPWVLRTVMLE